MRILMARDNKNYPKADFVLLPVSWNVSQGLRAPENQCCAFNHKRVRKLSSSLLLERGKIRGYVTELRHILFTFATIFLYCSCVNRIKKLTYSFCFSVILRLAHLFLFV